MLSVQTEVRFPLSSVKPLTGLLAYREFCLGQTRKALGKGGARTRALSPSGGGALEPAGSAGGLAYGKCQATGSLFLTELPSAPAWKELLLEVNRFRHSPQAFHQGLAQSRADHVYGPRLEWIRDTLRLQDLREPAVLEAATVPSDLTPLLKESSAFTSVRLLDEMDLAHGAALPSPVERGTVQAAILCESLDRVDDPEGLLKGVAEWLSPGGLLFITALAYSGFDMQALGMENLYLYPPDRANCFTVAGLQGLLAARGFEALEVSTPGVLDLEIVQAHLRRDPSLKLSGFERFIAEANPETRERFQSFLQENRLSSFARIVGRKVR